MRVGRREGERKRVRRVRVSVGRRGEERERVREVRVEVGKEGRGEREGERSEG